MLNRFAKDLNLLDVLMPWIFYDYIVVSVLFSSAGTRMCADILNDNLIVCGRVIPYKGG